MDERSYVPLPSGNPANIPPEGSMTPAVPTPVDARRDRSHPMTSLMASANRLTTSQITRSARHTSTAEAWQADAWEMYDLVGELRFLTNLLANQGSKANFYVGTLAPDPLDPPVPTEDADLAEVLLAIGNGPSGLQQLVKRLLVNLQIPGDGWFVGIPDYLMPGADPGSRPPGSDQGLTVSLDRLEWRMLSVTEVKIDGDKVTLSLGQAADEKVEASPDALWMIRIWNAHPNKSWEADSATRSSLSTLRELVGLTMHISAQIDSRLAGAGVLIAPDSAARAAKRAANLPEEGDEDPFTDALIKAMMTPISDRANASAYVPLVWTVPDESADHFHFMDFSKGLDVQAKDMRDESIRRYALGADAPPELLLGMDSMNHWGAWLVSEDTVRAHLEPPLALVADAFTTQYLRPVMAEMGYTDAQIEQTVVWFSVEHLISRPTRGSEASQAHSEGVISDAALRDAYGFSEADAPVSSTLSPAASIALDMVAKAPSLLQDPGLSILVAQIESLFTGAPAPAVPVAADADAEAPVAPQTPSQDSPAAGPPDGVSEPQIAASGITEFIGSTVIPHIARTASAPARR